MTQRCLARGHGNGRSVKVAQVKLVVLYPTPTDAEAFDRAYAEEHAPMVNENVPNVS
ncbi:MAG: hypothetical protein CYG60_05085, partial [Actinobacteria bacterium]